MTVSELITSINNVMINDVTPSTIVNWINILEDTIYTNFATDHDKPTAKTLESMGSDELSLLEFGHRWIQMYELYIYGQLCLVREEYGKANNYFMLYNSMIDEFVMFYFPTKSNPVREKRMKNIR